MGLSYGQSSGSTTGATSDTSSKTFNPGQTSLQTQLGNSLSADTAATDAGTLTPGVQAMETNSADQINKTAGGLTDRVNSFLAARGFGKSGTTGKAAVSGELGRESQLGANQANFAQVQQNANGTNLMAALNYALTQMGTTSAGTSSGTSKGSQFGAQVSGAMAF